MLQLCFLFVMFAFATENDYWVTDGLMEQTNSRHAITSKKLEFVQM